MIDQRVSKRSRVNSRAGMNHHPRGFIYDDHIVVFIDYVQGNRFRNQLDERRLGEIDLDLITITQSITGLHHVLVYENVAVYNGALSSSAAYFFELRSKE